MTMDVLVIGSGGREHALCWKISQSPLVGRVWAAPGNAGIAQCATCVPMAANDTSGIVHFAASHEVGLVVVGPEDPLTKGLADQLRIAGIRTLGPGAAGARLEGSKAFAKEFCQRHGIPAARAVACADAAEALDHLDDLGFPVVVKADGLAAGKGVIVAADRAEAQEAVQWLSGQGRVLLEEFLRGRECSLLFLCDGHMMIPLAPARDYKRVHDGDRGLNTGGMGGFSPVADVDPSVENEAYDRIVRNVLAGFAEEHMDYRGVFYAGCMLTRDGLRVLEFNCRFGDPETQVILPRVSGDIVPALIACADGRLDGVHLEWHDEAAVCVQMVSRGYPSAPETGMVIDGLEKVPEGVLVFHGGTRRSGSMTVTAGGRVLGITALGVSVAEARSRAYAAVHAIRFEGAHWRSDIAVVDDSGRKEERQ